MTTLTRPRAERSGTLSPRGVPWAGEGRSGFLPGFSDRGGPGRHHVGDAVIEPVLAAHDQVRAGEVRRPHRVLDQGRAAAGAEPLANPRGETAVDRDAVIAADVDARVVRRLFRGHREIDHKARHLHDRGEDTPATGRTDAEAGPAV